MTDQLTFAKKYVYPDGDSGITLPVILFSGGQFCNASAKVDTGAEVCLFSRETAEELGLPVEDGTPLTLSSLGGPIDSFGHEVTIQTAGIAITGMVYFAKHPGLLRNLLGRQGWLRQLRIAIVDYDNLLYLSRYDE